MSESNDQEPSTVEKSCLNCGQPLNGEFCSYCGQEDKEVRRPFLYFLQELIRVTFELDGRAYRTIFHLLFRPGFLSREYVSGRRAHYTPPLRLFLIISIGCFLLIALFNSINTMQASLRGVNDASSGITVPIATDEDLNELNQDIEDLNQDLADLGISVSVPEAALDGGTAGLTIEGELNDDSLEEMFAFINNVNISFLSEQSNQNLRTLMRNQGEENARQLMENPSEFLINSLDYITVFMLLMMPILALIQKILYFFSKRFYVEHLILTLHNQAFVIFAIFLLVTLDLIESSVEVAIINNLFSMLVDLVSIWVPVYLYLSQKTFFGTGYGQTALLFLATSICYAFSLSFGLVGFLGLVFFLV